MPSFFGRLQTKAVLALSGLVIASSAVADTAIQAVTLSTSGLAMIEATGQMGEDPLHLSVPRDEIDDFLKSLWVIDPAGAVSFVTMTGPGTVEDSFAHFPFGPGDVTDPVRLLNAMVGAPLEVQTLGEPVRGLNMGVTTRACGEGNTCSTLTVRADDGRVMGFELDTNLRFQFTEGADQQAVIAALRTLRQGGNQSRIDLSMSSDNAEPRNVGLVYLQNAPLWRTAWRAVDTDEGIRLIGWAVVENTTGLDWDDIELTLATGAVRNISTQLYTRRYAMREHEQAGGSPMAPMVESEMAVGGMAMSRAVLASPAPSFADMAERDVSVAEVQADDGDSFSRFTLSTPITLAAGQMMSVPFLSETLDDARLTLYRGGSGALHPTIAISLENPLPLRLPAGVLTLYENGRGHAGDAQIPEMAPGATEIIEFASDTAVEIREETSTTETVREMRLANGVLYVTEDLERRVTYRIEGAPEADRTITIDHPRRANWTVSSSVGAEETADAWRWEVDVAAGTREALTVTERTPRSRRVGLMDIDMQTLAFWQSRSPNAEVTEILERFAGLRTQVHDAELEERNQRNEASRLEREQGRLVNLIVQLGDGGDSSRERRARVDAIEAEIAQANDAAQSARDRAEALHREIAELIGTR